MNCHLEMQPFSPEIVANSSALRLGFRNARHPARGRRPIRGEALMRPSAGGRAAKRSTHRPRVYGKSLHATRNGDMAHGLARGGRTVVRTPDRPASARNRRPEQASASRIWNRMHFGRSILRRPSPAGRVKAPLYIGLRLYLHPLPGAGTEVAPLCASAHPAAAKGAARQEPIP